MKTEDLEACIENSKSVCESCTEKNCDVCYLSGINVLLESLSEEKDSDYRINLAYIKKQPKLKSGPVHLISLITRSTCSTCPDRMADICSECSISKMRQLSQLIVHKKIKSI